MIQESLLDPVTNAVRSLPVTPTTFKTALATASGSTALWTPASGKKFRIMRFMIEVSANTSATTGAVVHVTLLDANTPTNLTHSLFAPTSAVTTTAGNALVTPWIDLGQGILSATANNVLNISLSAALATGTCRVLVCGTEE
jgi:hypothetical protein